MTKTPDNVGETAISTLSDPCGAPVNVPEALAAARNEAGNVIPLRRRSSDRAAPDAAVPYVPGPSEDVQFALNLGEAIAVGDVDGGYRGSQPSLDLLPDMEWGREPVILMEFAGNRSPYHRHMAKVGRSAATGLLTLCIESYLAPDPVTNPDNAPGRVVMGPLYKMGRDMAKIAALGHWEQRLLTSIGRAPGMLADIVNDMALARTTSNLGWVQR